MQEIIQKFNLQENHDLSQYSTMRIGGKAQYFYEASDQGKLVSLLNELYSRKIPFHIFGAGANCLFADKLYKGVAIRNRTNKIFVQDSKIKAESGVTIGQFNTLCKEHGLSGLEMLMRVPGTIGGAIWNNAGAYDMEISSIVVGGKVWDKGKVKAVDKAFFEFGYRTSIFKKSQDLVLLEAEFELKSVGKEEIEKRMEEICKMRLEKEPKGLTCGSFFRNPKNDFAGRLLEEIGAKNLKVGDLEVAEKHANWLLNKGNAKPEDLIKLRDILKSKVKERFGVELQEELDIITS
jgi:UDP-N-acetylmuramate dehydrogenase